MITFDFASVEDIVLRGLALIASKQPSAKVEIEDDWIFCGDSGNDAFQDEERKALIEIGWWPEHLDHGRWHTVWTPTETIMARYKVGDQVITHVDKLPGAIVEKGDSTLTILIRKPTSIACIYTGGKAAAGLKRTGARYTPEYVEKLRDAYRKACGGEESLP